MLGCYPTGSKLVVCREKWRFGYRIRFTALASRFRASCGPGRPRSQPDDGCQRVVGADAVARLKPGGRSRREAIAGVNRPVSGPLESSQRCPVVPTERQGRSGDLCTGGLFQGQSGIDELALCIGRRQGAPRHVTPAVGADAHAGGTQLPEVAPRSGWPGRRVGRRGGRRWLAGRVPEAPAARCRRRIDCRRRS